jgi:hypothetical protein
MKKLSLVASTLALTVFACAAEDPQSGLTTATEDSATADQAITVLSVTVDADGNAVSTKEEKISLAKMEALSAARREKQEAIKAQLNSASDKGAAAKTVDKALEVATLTQDTSCLDIPTSTWLYEGYGNTGNTLCLISDGAYSAGFDIGSVGWGNGRVKSVWGDAYYQGGIYPYAWSYCELPGQYGPCDVWDPWSPKNINSAGCNFVIIPRWCTSIVH